MPESLISKLFKGRGGSEDEQPPVNPDQPQNQESIDQPATSTTAESATGMPEVSSLEPKDPSISIVLNQIARMLESGDLPDGVNRDAIATTTRTLMALDRRIFDTNNQLKEKSPLKALVAAAENMSEENRKIVLDLVESVRSQIIKEIREMYQDSLVTDSPLSLEQAKERYLNKRALEKFATWGKSRLNIINSLDAINELLQNILGYDLNTLKRNEEVWRGGSPAIMSPIIPGLYVSIYDRVAMRQQKLVEGQEAHIEISLDIRDDAEAKQAMVLEVIEGMDNS